MQVEHGKIEGDLSVAGELVLHGMVTGSIRVLSGGNLTLHGMCSTDLVVEKDGIAYVPGMVSGNATNQGGVLKVSGTICGHLTTHSGQTEVVPGAVVDGIEA